jgi:hypothetical protein
MGGQCSPRWKLWGLTKNKTDLKLCPITTFRFSNTEASDGNSKTSIMKQRFLRPVAFSVRSLLGMQGTRYVISGFTFLRDDVGPATTA